MADKNVTVVFDPPAKVANSTDGAYLLELPDDAIWISRKHVAPLKVGKEYSELCLPKWLAVNEGFMPDDGHDSPYVEAPPAPLPITRYDLIQAVALHALLSHRWENRTAVYESEKIAILATKDD